MWLPRLGPAKRLMTTRSDRRIVPIRWLQLGGLAMALTACGCGTSRVEELITAARSEDLSVRHAALRELATLGPTARPATSVLVGGCNDDDAETRRLSSLALGELYQADPESEDADCPPEVRHAVGSCLSYREQSVRMAAAYSLLKIDPVDTEAQEVLATAMRRGDGGVIDRLGRQRPPPMWVIPTLIEILAVDRRAGSRRLAAVALGRMGTPTDEVQAALQKGLEDDDDRVRAAAQEALDQLQRSE